MGKKVLVIDDDLAILEVIKIILEDKGYEVNIISDSTRVMSYFDSVMPNLVLLDFWMSGLNGRKVAALIKGRENGKRIPLIMISANHEVEKISEEVGADGFLAKPFDIDDLVNTVEKYISPY